MTFEYGTKPVLVAPGIPREVWDLVTEEGYSVEQAWDIYDGRITIIKEVDCE